MDLFEQHPMQLQTARDLGRLRRTLVVVSASPHALKPLLRSSVGPPAALCDMLQNTTKPRNGSLRSWPIPPEGCNICILQEVVGVRVASNQLPRQAPKPARMIGKITDPCVRARRRSHV